MDFPFLGTFQKGSMDSQAKYPQKTKVQPLDNTSAAESASIEAHRALVERTAQLRIKRDRRVFSIVIEGLIALALAVFAVTEFLFH